MKKYNITIKFLRGNKDINKFIKMADMGNGYLINDEISFTTTTKPTDRLVKKYKEAVIRATTENKESNCEIDADSIRVLLTY